MLDVGCDSMKFKRKQVAIVSIIVCITVVSILVVCLLPNIHLVGERKIEINVQESYKEPGYSASAFFKNVTDKVTVESNVDTKKVGEYHIIYRLNYGRYHTKEKRKVSVVDKEKPKITLHGNESTFVCPSNTYEEEGYEAIDNYDGDITDKVVVKKEKDKISYTISDTSGNTKTVERKLVYEDKEAPHIVLTGDAAMNVYLGSSYTEPGYVATDGCEGDITSKVVVTGEVNTNQVGEYTLTYKVEDTNGNQQTATRTIKVIKRTSNGSGKTIYLTFDDGPSRTITPQVLQILREENVKATFFVTNQDDSLNYLIRQASDEGHTIALHSYTHDYGYIYSSTANYFQDLTSIQNKVEGITGKKSTIIRFPGGSSNTVSRRYQSGIMSVLSKEVTNRGYTYFDWNISSGDAGGARTKEDVYTNVTSNLYYQNNVVLMHDFENNYKTLNALRDIIHYGKENGYTFKAITNDTPVSHHRVNN